MVRLSMDVHIPAAITRALRQRGVDVLTAQEDGARRFLDDLQLIAEAMTSEEMANWVQYLPL